jgi:hypothetical protein
MKYVGLKSFTPEREAELRGYLRDRLSDGGLNWPMFAMELLNEIDRLRSKLRE